MQLPVQWLLLLLLMLHCFYCQNFLSTQVAEPRRTARVCDMPRMQDGRLSPPRSWQPWQHEAYALSACKANILVSSCPSERNMTLAISSHVTVKHLSLASLRHGLLIASVSRGGLPGVNPNSWPAGTMNVARWRKCLWGVSETASKRI